MATHPSILAWRILWTEKPGGLQSMGLQRIGSDCVCVCARQHTPAHACARAHAHTHRRAHTHTLQVKVYRKINCVNQSRELEQLHQFQTRWASEHGRSSGIKGAVHDDEGSAFLRDLTVFSVCAPNNRASRYTD